MVYCLLGHDVAQCCVFCVFVQQMHVACMSTSVRVANA